MNAVPDWLIPRSTDEIDIDPDNPDGERISAVTRRELLKEIEHRRYESVFERFLDDVAQGKSIRESVKEYPLEINLHSMMLWIIRNPERKEAYYEAQKVSAELMMPEMVEIADAKNSMEDVARSQLRFNARKHAIAVYNRERFGDVKQIEQTFNVNLAAAIDDANKRLHNARTVDVPVRLIDDGN